MLYMEESVRCDTIEKQADANFDLLLSSLIPARRAGSLKECLR